jgi:hypothetical protein
MQNLLRNHKNKLYFAFFHQVGFKLKIHFEIKDVKYLEISIYLYEKLIRQHIPDAESFFYQVWFIKIYILIKRHKIFKKIDSF